MDQPVALFVFYVNDMTIRNQQPKLVDASQAIVGPPDAIKLPNQHPFSRLKEVGRAERKGR